jgi:glycosyltransferase involved in cell wall biosynthesis
MVECAYRFAVPAFRDTVHFGAWDRARRANVSPSCLPEIYGDPRRIIILVDQYIPRPDHDAGSRSILEIMDGLVEMGWRVVMWPNNLWFEPCYTEALRAGGIEVVHGSKHADRLPRFAAALGDRLQAVILSRPRIARQWLPALRRASSARIVYYGHDIHSDRMRRQRKIDPWTMPGWEVSYMEEMERSVWKTADITWYPSPEEVARVRAEVPRARAERIPVRSFGPAHESPGREGRDPGRMLFVGNFSHLPNVDAAQWFVSEILPAVLQGHPTAKLWLVGYDPARRIDHLRGPSVVVTGGVSDGELMAQYDRSMVVVAPLRFGAGVKGKVLEAMHLGVPLVTTPVGVQGLADLDEGIAVARDASVFASCVLDLLGSRCDWDARSRGIRSYVQQHFSRSALHAALRSSLD